MTKKKLAVAKVPGGMGAILHKKGVAFRVWAPNAEQVYVTGTFNDWSETKLSHEADGYWATNITKAKVGDEYKYIIVNGEQKLSRVDPYARKVTNSVGNGIIYDPFAFEWGDDDFQMPAWNELVIYELHIGTFNDEPGGSPGDFKSAIKRLAYLSDLGINAVEVMPPMEFPGGFSWGYNPAYLFAIESDYGGPDAFKAFVKAAHAHGIAVILDVVYNHLGPSDLGLWQFDGWSENGHGGIYFYNDWRSETPWGATRPDYGRGAVRQYLRDNALAWLEEYRVDGLRWDMTAYIRNIFANNNDPSSDLAEGWELFQWINDEINTYAPEKISIAEDLQSNPWLTKDTGAGGAGFDAQWAADFVHPVRQAMIVTEDAQRDIQAVGNAIGHRYNDDAFERVIYTESHDEVANGRARLPEDIHPGSADSWYAKKRSTLGAALVFTAPGIPMIFQGQEFLEDEWFRDQNPIDWSKRERFAGILELYRDLIGLRRNKDGLTAGLTGHNTHVYHLNDEAKVLAFHRWAEGGAGDSVVIIANLANHPYTDYTLGFPLGGVWQVRFNSDSQKYDPDFANQGSVEVLADEGEGDDLPFKGNIDLSPYSVLILAQDAETT